LSAGTEQAETVLGGTCDERFAPVRQAFAENFSRLGERGGAVSVVAEGKTVVDLWGGWADVARSRLWQRETIVNFFSVSKALCAIAAMRVVETGRIKLDEPVAVLWPEFAKNGKSAITFRELLSHRAGLPALREPLEDGAMLDWRTMTEALARERPWWPPGSAHGYHVNTFGFLVGEIVRRATGQSIGQYLRDTVAGPLDADVHIGLPESEHHRVAEFLWPGNPARPDALARPEAVSDDDLMRWNCYWNPPGFSGGGWVNTAPWRSAEIPSTNGHGNARGIARIYAALANGGAIDGIQILSAESLSEATREHSCGHDLINQRTSRFGLGFQLTQPERPLGPNPGAFGHFGAGGSLAFCDPQAGIAFGYMTNDMGPRWQNPRNRALINAVYACV
jgi:CubicO group peptidase (beta-lactamase class C family)